MDRFCFLHGFILCVPATDCADLMSEKDVIVRHETSTCVQE